MRFDTLTFWLFFALAWSAWRTLSYSKAKASALLASLVFYAWWNPAYLLLIAASTLIDWQAGFRIHQATDPRARRRWLLVSLVSNLGLLAFFKYLPFVAENCFALQRALGYEPSAEIQRSLAGWVVPVGISFYTFQTLSYTIDVWRGRLAPERHLADFALYVTFFPQLVAGPIVRASEFLPQLRRRRALTPAAVQAGLYACIAGLFLKIVIADNLAPEVDRLFRLAEREPLLPLEAWLGSLYFSAQIYADFAGYSSIAIGLAYLMGLRFPENFRYPFLATGPAEFWRRWHISLSSWLRDYLYIPLGGNRSGPRRTYANLMATMLLGGLWHGASWNFVIWGALHGLALCVERLLRGERPARVPAAWWRGSLAWLAFMLFLLLTWVPFRAPTLGVAATFFERMLVAPWREPFGWSALENARYLVLLLPVAGTHLVQLGSERGSLASRSTYRRALAAACMLFLLLVVARRDATAFLYFQF